MKKPTPSIFTAFAALALLLAPPAARADEERHPYACDNGSRLEIVFADDAEGRPQATLRFADGEVRLPRIASVGDARYRAGDIRLSTRDDAAVIEDGKGNIRRCRRGDMPPLSTPPAPSPAAGSAFLDIAGRVVWPSATIPPAGATLTVRIRDARRPTAQPLAEQQYALDGSPAPIPFSATVDRDLLGKKVRLRIRVTVAHQGRLLFAGEAAYPPAHGAGPLEIVPKPLTRIHRQRHPS